MNIAPHGLLLQVIAWLINFQHGFRLSVAAEPGYLDFDNLPETNFSCEGKVIGGYYADVETGCQMFHVCTVGQKDETMDIKFLCLNGTVFDQETRVCERVDEVDCSKSERFYNLNLELYGNNAVTLSLHETSEDDGEPTEPTDGAHLRTTSARPITTTSTTTTTPRPTRPPTTVAVTTYQQPTGYPQHYQPQPPFPSVQTSQSKSLFDDKNGGFHHQYIFHNGEQNNNHATSFQLFNQGVSSTTNVPPQVHQVRYSSTPDSQLIHNQPSTIAPLFHGPSSTIQTLLNSNVNNPTLLNPLFHNHGVASTTEQFILHSSNPRETQEYHDNVNFEEHDGRKPLEPIQPTSKGKVSKLAISSVASSADTQAHSTQLPENSSGFLPTPIPAEPTVRSFYPTPRSSPKSEISSTQLTQHIHLPPPPTIPQLKPHQITINLPPPDVHRIVQSPSPLLPSQSRVIVTARASVSDESGRALNTSQLVTLPLPTIPASYDDYKEGDESFDPFYRDVPKIRGVRHLVASGTPVADTTKVEEKKRNRSKREASEEYSDYEEGEETILEPKSDEYPSFSESEEIMDIKTIKANLKKFKALLLGRLPSGDSGEDEYSEPKALGSQPRRTKIAKTKLMVESSASDRETDVDDYIEPGKVTTLKKDVADVGNKSVNMESHVENSGETEEIEAPDGLKSSGDEHKYKSARYTKDSDHEEYFEPKSVLNTKASDSEEYIEPKSAPNTRDDEVPSDALRKYIEAISPLNTKKSDFEKHIEPESVANTEASDHEEYVAPKSAPNIKESDLEEYIKPKSTLDTRETDYEEHIKPKSVVNTKESDLEEYIELKSALNTKEADLEKYVKPKSALDTEESDSEEPIEPKSTLDTRESDHEEYIEPKSVVDTRESDLGEYIEPKSASNTKESDLEEYIEPKSASNTKESDLEEYIEPKSASNTKESDLEEYIELKSASNTKEADLEENVKPKSALHTKESDLEEYIEPKSILDTKESDHEEYIEPKSVADTEESDLEEYIEPKSASNTNESDLEEYIEPKSASNAKGADLEEYVEPKSAHNTKESDLEEYIEPKSILDTEESDHEEYIEPKSVVNTKESDSEEYIEPKSASNTKESDLEEYIEPKSVSNTEGSDREEYIELKSASNTKGSDRDEYIEPKHISNGNDTSYRKNTETASTKSEIEEQSTKSANKRIQGSHSVNAKTAVGTKQPEIDGDAKKSSSNRVQSGGKLSQTRKTESKSNVVAKSTLGSKNTEDERRKIVTPAKSGNADEPEVSPPVSLETENDEQIESKIFDEPESRSSKEVDTRAVAQYGPEFPKSLGKTDVIGKVAKEKTMGLRQMDTNSNVRPNILGDETSVEENSSTGRANEEEEYIASEENAPSTESDYDESVQYSDEYSEERSNETPNKISSREEPESARKHKSLKFDKDENISSSDEKLSHRQDKSRKFKGTENDYEEFVSDERIATASQEGYETDSEESVSPKETSVEVISTESSAEYPNSNEASIAVSHESEAEYDSREALEDVQASVEDYAGSEESSSEDAATTGASSSEDVETTTSTENDRTEGVLKFTDEIPRAKDKDSAPNRTKAEREKETVQDYVDDNYEPDHYKEADGKPSAVVDSEDKKPKKNETDIREDRQNDEAKMASFSNDERSDMNGTEIDESTETAEEMSSTEEMTTTSTTTTTTTRRPTPPSLFKPFSLRKNYNFFPPSTTPNPVIIRHRFGLSNPKPSKPLKSYNDLVAKPVIRKRPLLARRTYPVGRTTEKIPEAQKRIDEFENSSELIYTSTEVVGDEENVLETRTRTTDESPSRESIDSSSEVTPSETEASSRSDPEEISNVSETNVPKYSSTESTEDAFRNTVTTSVATTASVVTPYPLLKASTIVDPVVADRSDANDTPTTGMPPDTGEPAVTIEAETTIVPASDAPAPVIPTAPTNERDSSYLPVLGEAITEYPQTRGNDGTINYELTSVRSVKTTTARPNSRTSTTFSCLEKEMYRFHGDTRDCRLFHYCSPGFTSRQVLDFRFVCEEGTMFDEETQSCRHDIKNPICANRHW